MGSLSEWLGTLVAAGGGGALVALAIFRWLGTKWLETKIAARLQELRHQHDQTIEQLRFRISGLLDRATKLNQQEFDVLPEAWALTFDAYVETERLLARLRTYPDFSKMKPAHFEEVVSDSPLSDWQRQELRDLPISERLKYYTDALFWHDLHKAKVAAQAADFCLSKKGIFLDQDVYDRLRAFLRGVWSAISTHELIREYRGMGEPLPKDRPDDLFRDTADAQIKDLESFIRQRFRHQGELVATAPQRLSPNGVSP